MERKKSIVILSLGSNLGDKSKNISEAINLIQSNIGCVLKTSDLVETEPMDFNSQNNFLNCCCTLESVLEPTALLVKLKQIEKELGRTHKGPEYRDRTIDIDIIFYSSEILHSKNLIIPHPNFRKRKFVTIPLAQISNHQDPITYLTIKQFNS